MSTLLYTAKGSAGIIKLRLLGRGDYPGLSTWAQYNRKGPYRREAGGQGQKRCADGSRGQSAAIAGKGP